MQSNSLQYRLEPIAYQAPHAKPTLVPGAQELLQEVCKPGCQVGMHSLWHQGVTPPGDALSRHVMSLIDGTRSATELRSAVRDALTSGRHAHPSGQSYKGGPATWSPWPRNSSIPCWRNCVAPASC